MDVDITDLIPSALFMDAAVLHSHTFQVLSRFQDGLCDAHKVGKISYIGVIPCCPSLAFASILWFVSEEVM